MPGYALKARYVVPINAPAISDGVVHIEGRTITGIIKTGGDLPVIDLGNVALLPALVNAHTHLEFSDLDSPLGAPNIGFADWIRSVLSHRQQTMTGDPQTSTPTNLAKKAQGKPMDAVVSLGLDESIRCGVGMLGEISTLTSVGAPWEPTLANGITFLELIALSPTRRGEILALARQVLDEETPNSRWQIGLSPHAPYTASHELVKQAVALAAQYQTCVAMHIAETRDELQLLQKGDGPLRGLLEERKVWHASAFQSGSRPLDYLRLLSRAPRALVIHGNYLDNEEIQFMAEHNGQMSVVYCPRTHAYFGHDVYPLTQMLGAGVNVALGTDSRASNPNLDLLQEMRFLARSRDDITAETILKLGTLHGALALGVEDRLGSLAAGKTASMIAIPLSDPNVTDPLPGLLHSDVDVALVILDGVPVYSTNLLRSHAVAISTAS